MDTRSKIKNAASLPAVGRVAIVTGYFDPLLAWHARQLERILDRASGLIAVVMPLPDAFLPQVARAALVAALRMVDYVIIANNEDLDRIFSDLNPIEIVRLEDEDLRRRAELVEDVRGRQHRR